MWPYVAIAAVILVAVYLAWVYYFLFCKEKPKKVAPGIFNVHNQEFYFPKPKKRSGFGKYAIPAFILARKRRNETEVKTTESETAKDVSPKSKGLDNPYFTNPEEKMGMGKEEKSVHFEREKSTSPVICHERDLSTTYGSGGEDHGYGTLPANSEADRDY